MSETTVVYYTHNQEIPSFEERIQASILEHKGDLPLISVSQKPIDFGENICVGEVGVNSLNTWRQVLIGCQAAKTKFVCLAESDTLHSSEYFSFVPERDDIHYIITPLYIFFVQRGKSHLYYNKPYSDNQVIVGRDCMIDHLTILLKGLPEWQKEGDYEKNAFIGRPDIQKNIVIIEQQIGIVTFKTDQNMHRKSVFRRGGFREIPYWGTSKQLMEKYFS